MNQNYVLKDLTLIPDLNTLISRNKQPFNQVKINNEFYFNLKNNLELELMNPENNAEEEYHYPFKIDFKEIKETGEIKIESIKQLLQLLTYFAVEKQLRKNIILQSLGVSVFKTKNKFDLKAIKECIQKFNLQQFSSENLAKMNLDQEKFNALNKEYKIITKKVSHKIFEIQFLPMDFEEIDNALLKNQRDLITDKQTSDFLSWKNYLSTKGTRTINVFLKKFDLQDLKYTLTHEVQEYINTYTNEYPIEEEFQISNTIRDSEALRKSYFDFEKVHVHEQQKVIVEMRNINGKLRLATKTSQIKHLPFLFKQMRTDNSLNHEIISQYRKRIFLNQPLFCMFLDIKDLCLNIDYNVLEHVLGLNKLSNYLRQREIYHIDGETNELNKLHIKKGVFIGEVFVPALITEVCKLIKTTIEKSLQNGLFAMDIKTYNLKVWKYQDDFFIRILDKDITYYTTKKCQEDLKFFENPDNVMQLLQFVISGLKEIGFEINETKSRILIQRQNERTIWKMKDDDLEECYDFTLLKQDMLEIQSDNEKNQEILYFLKKLIMQQKSDPDFENKYSLVEQFSILKFIKRYKQQSVQFNLIDDLHLKLIADTYIKNLNLSKDFNKYFQSINY